MLLNLFVYTLIQILICHTKFQWEVRLLVALGCILQSFCNFNTNFPSSAYYSDLSKLCAIVSKPNAGIVLHAQNDAGLILTPSPWPLLYHDSHWDWYAFSHRNFGIYNAEAIQLYTLYTT